MNPIAYRFISVGFFTVALLALCRPSPALAESLETDHSAAHRTIGRQRDVSNLWRRPCRCEFLRRLCSPQHADRQQHPQAR